MWVAGGGGVQVGCEGGRWGVRLCVSVSLCASVLCMGICLRLVVYAPFVASVLGCMSRASVRSVFVLVALMIARH